jgi:hypothetical protein
MLVGGAARPPALDVGLDAGVRERALESGSSSPQARPSAAPCGTWAVHQRLRHRSCFAHSGADRIEANTAGAPIPVEVRIGETERQDRANGHRKAWLAVVAGNARARAFYERAGWVDEGPSTTPPPLRTDLSRCRAPLHEAAVAVSASPIRMEPLWSVYGA